MKINLLLLLLLSLSACLTIRVNPRGYADLLPEQRSRYAPFDTSVLRTGMGAGENMREITAAQIQQAGMALPLLVVVHANTSCQVGEYPLRQWQVMADTVQRHNGRFMVITERYDAYAPLQEALKNGRVSYPVVVLSGAHYGDDDDKVSAKYWKEMLGRDVPGAEYLVKEGQLMVFKRSTEPRFVPALGFMSY